MNKILKFFCKKSKTNKILVYALCHTTKDVKWVFPKVYQSMDSHSQVVQKAILDKSFTTACHIDVAVSLVEYNRYVCPKNLKFWYHGIFLRKIKCSDIMGGIYVDVPKTITNEDSFLNNPPSLERNPLKRQSAISDLDFIQKQSKTSIFEMVKSLKLDNFNLAKHDINFWIQNFEMTIKNHFSNISESDLISLLPYYLSKELAHIFYKFSDESPWQTVKSRFVNEYEKIYWKSFENLYEEKYESGSLEEFMKKKIENLIEFDPRKHEKMTVRKAILCGGKYKEKLQKAREYDVERFIHLCWSIDMQFNNQSNLTNDQEMHLMTKRIEELKETVAQLQSCIQPSVTSNQHISTVPLNNLKSFE